MFVDRVICRSGDLISVIAIGVISKIGQIPLLVRRGGCAIKKMSRSHRNGADGVVAYESFLSFKVFPNRLQHTFKVVV